MTIEEIRKGAPLGAEYYCKKLGYLKDVFGRNSKPKIWVDNKWNRFDPYSSLTVTEFKEIKPLN